MITVANRPKISQPRSRSKSRSNSLKNYKENENPVFKLRAPTTIIKSIEPKQPLPRISRSVKPVQVNGSVSTNGNRSAKKKIILKIDNIPKETNVDYQEDDKLTPDSWIKRSSYLIRLTGKFPLNAEPPLTMLFKNGFKTPNEIFFVRNHGPVPKIDFNKHRIIVTGLVKNELVLTMEDIMNMEMITIRASFACTGNRRKELNLLRKTRGFNYGAAAIGSAEWTGVPLCKILEKAGIKSSLNAHVHLEGSDDLPKGTYDTSVPLLWCLDSSKNYMLAVKMNGDPLPYDHGYPIRAILPGLTGGRMIKWLKTVRVLEEESTNYYHVNDNRVLPPYADEEYIAAHKGIVEKKEYCVLELNIQSVIVYPEHDEVIDTRKSDTYTIKGMAHTGGLRWINRVDITLDKGVTWRQAEIIRFEKELTYDANFNLVFWKLDVPTKDIYQATEISVKAVDSAFNTQAENRIWNVMGMMNNCWYKLKLTRNDAFCTMCKHPTLPGAQPGGWMEKEKPKWKIMDDEEISALPEITWDEIQEQKKTKILFVINNLVYDVTKYHTHPGGNDTLKAYNGEDCSDEFNSIHSIAAFKEAKKFIVGRISESKSNSKNENLACVVKKEYVNHNDILLQLKTKKDFSSEKCFHIMLKHPDFEFARPYTPIEYENGVMSIIIKIYEPLLPNFPNGGKFTQILKSVKVGEELKVMGPFGDLEYVAKGLFRFKGDSFSANNFHFFGAGTGIAPIYSWIKKMLQEDEKSLKISVTHCCPNEGNVLLNKEFTELFKKSGRQMAVNYIYREVDGYLTLERISKITGKTIDSNTVCFLCGRQSFNDSVKQLLKKLGCIDSNLFEF